MWRNTTSWFITAGLVFISSPTACSTSANPVALGLFLINKVCQKSLFYDSLLSPEILQDSCSTVYIFAEYLIPPCALSLPEYQDGLFFQFPWGTQSFKLSLGGKKKKGTWLLRYDSLELFYFKNKNQSCIRSVSALPASRVCISFEKVGKGGSSAPLIGGCCIQVLIKMSLLAYALHRS